jgi:hypothetical protein
MKEAVLYTREGASAGAPRVEADYPAKFSNLVRLANARQADMAVVAFPGVLGDTYDEVMQSLSLLAERGLQLTITKPQPGAVPLGKLRQQRRRGRKRR